jgi:SpoVK/Ycf46/Vps4 family AAA+-type ATPase
MCQPANLYITIEKSEKKIREQDSEARNEDSELAFFDRIDGIYRDI